MVRLDFAGTGSLDSIARCTDKIEISFEETVWIYIHAGLPPPRTSRS